MPPIFRTQYTPYLRPTDDTPVVISSLVDMRAGCVKRETRTSTRRRRPLAVTHTIGIKRLSYSRETNEQRLLSFTGQNVDTGRQC